MATRAGRSGGTAVRWTYGVIVALCAALAVLVHHEVPTAGASPMPGMSHAALPAALHAAHVMPDAVEASVSGSSTHNLDDGGCAGAGGQHCSAASVGSVQLVAPVHGEFSPLVNLPQALSGHAPGAVVSRAPPDLSVLSQLRI
ncbi:hypothetical protein [Streptomyces mirabilis]|uniref:hypothetical protein n=1 Tax=Streptomyces mirabilis TaxID=68239 RepID=UPI0021C13FD3|nr:hypothetical protein [Streptomyces mirabilis]MCT9113311.1 hypothetical protein [Streptomyces mirabilis]